MTKESFSPPPQHSSPPAFPFQIDLHRVLHQDVGQIYNPANLS